MKFSIRPWMKSSGWMLSLLFAICMWAGSGRLRADEGKKSPDDKKSPDKATSTQPSDPVGCRLAPGMIALLEDEIKDGLKRRGIESRFAQFAAYAGRTLDNSAGDRSWSELAGNCRLNWYDKLYRNPSKATAETEQFTRKLHQAVSAGDSGLGRVLDMAAEKLDLKTQQAQSPVQTPSPDEALSAVKRAVAEAKTASEAIPKNAAGSVLCHASVGNWCKMSGNEIGSQEMKERCRRLTADVAARTVELLNANLHEPCKFAGLSPEVKSCLSCHNEELHDTMGKMRCNACHQQLSTKHPAVPGNPLKSDKGASETQR